MGISPRVIASTFVLLFLISPPVQADCPAVLDSKVRQLRSDQTINLCERYSGQPLLVVNTASFCGYTGQFEGLEALYQTYGNQGLEILGMPSGDFNQEADYEARTAEICFVNYGVTFTMTEAQSVRGPDAHPLFRELARQTGAAPRWNFFKYLVDQDGDVVAHFPSRVAPDDPALIDAIESVLGHE